MNGLRLAISFLTILPLRPPSQRDAVNHWRSAVIWFPFAGALVGGLAWGAGWGAEKLYGNWLAATVAVAVWVALTGGLHLDGLVDCCDGLLATVETPRRLEIMRDPRVGAFGAMGLVLTLGLKIGAVQEALAAGEGAAILTAAVLGRTAVLWAARQPPARGEGLGALFARQMSTRTLLLASVPGLAIALMDGWRGGLEVLGAFLTTTALGRLARRRIGGMSGDVLGLTVEIVELVVLLVSTAQFR